MQLLNAAKDTLRDIGLQLDRDQYPCVHNGGTVRPGVSTVVSSCPGESTNHDYERSRTAPFAPRQGAQTSQGASDGSWTSGSTPSLISPSLRCEQYKAELGAVADAYPGALTWQQDDGMWLLTESAVLPELGKKATFLTALPYSAHFFPRGWGFWTTPVSWEWIGPRHTNFPDGSICAFNPQDGTWAPGDAIVTLLDLYTLWAFRHEHLQTFGRWPGLQSVPHAYERLSEFDDDEYCGCGKSRRRYRDCCKKRDTSRSKIQIFVEFYNFTAGKLDRKPPVAVCEFMQHRKEPPNLKAIFTTD